jgi:hypothetical protein
MDTSAANSSERRKSEVRGRPRARFAKESLQAVARIAMTPNLVPMPAIAAVQQPCSNPSKYPETLRKAS